MKTPACPGTGAEDDQVDKAKACKIVAEILHAKGCRESTVVVVRKAMCHNSPLTQIASAQCAFARLLRPTQCRKLKRPQNRDDGDHNKKFDQGKTFFCGVIVQVPEALGVIMRKYLTWIIHEPSAANADHAQPQTQRLV
jgi:hypothetical protein